MQKEVEAKQVAQDARLRYVQDGIPGMSRIKQGKIFIYKDVSGKLIRDKAVIERINNLAFPPAYKNVWICPYPNGHLQATGIDDRGRKQYRYHLKWREVRDENKYNKMLDFGKSLPKIRKQIKKDLNQDGLSKEKVVAAIIELLEKTLIRVGNEEYAKENKSYGLTTLHNKHVEIHGSKVHFEFKGKSGVHHAIDLNDKKLAKIIKSCRDLPGQELFQFVDHAGIRHPIRSEEVNEYLQRTTGHEFTAKDFRTWYGTVLAAEALKAFKEFDTEAEAKRNIVNTIESVAKSLGNTKAVCRKCYIHPAVIDSYMDKTLVKNLHAHVSVSLKAVLHSLSPEEAAVMAFLEKRLREK
jgi:DNA topoisomerase-1